MALIKCKECGKDISDSSTECIHCGAPTSISIPVKNVPTKRKKNSNKHHIVIIIFICILVICILVLTISPFMINRKKNNTSINMLNDKYSAPDQDNIDMRIILEFKNDGTVIYKKYNDKTDDITSNKYIYKKQGLDIDIYDSDNLLFDCSLSDNNSYLRCYDISGQYLDYFID